MSAAEPPSTTWPAYARQVVTCAALRTDTRPGEPPPNDARPHSGVFVTLHKLGHLRGCMGTLDASLSVAEAVRQAAVCAAAQDPRFPPVAPGELGDLHVEVSILSPPWQMRSLDELELGRHGIIVRHGARRGLFLPQVATTHRLTKEEFVSRCCTEKAGLPPDAWRDPNTEVLLFTADVFEE